MAGQVSDGLDIVSGDDATVGDAATELDLLELLGDLLDGLGRGHGIVLVEDARDGALEEVVDLGHLGLLQGDADDVVLVDLHLRVGLAKRATQGLRLLHGETAIVDHEEALGGRERGTDLLEHVDLGLSWHVYTSPRAILHVSPHGGTSLEECERPRPAQARQGLGDLL